MRITLIVYEQMHFVGLLNVLNFEHIEEDVEFELAKQQKFIITIVMKSQKVSNQKLIRNSLRNKSHHV